MPYAQSLLILIVLSHSLTELFVSFGFLCCAFHFVALNRGKYCLTLPTDCLSLLVPFLLCCIKLIFLGSEALPVNKAASVFLLGNIPKVISRSSHFL